MNETKTVNVMYVVQMNLGDDGREEMVNVGVYLTRERARARIEELEEEVGDVGFVLDEVQFFGE